GRRAAAIGDFRHPEFALEHQELAKKMSGLALALVAVIDLAGIGAGVSNEVLQIIEGKVGAGDQDQRIGRKHADRLERVRVERWLRKEEVRDAERELRRAKKRVAVGR